MDVSLTLSEILTSATVGVMRQIAAIKRSLQDKHGLPPENGWSAHIEGACGERVLAKALGLHWDGSINTFQVGGDVGGLEVRTRSRHEHELIVRHGDGDQKVYVLVTGVCGKYRVRGWMRGKEAKRAEWLVDHGARGAPAYFVPTSELHSLKEFDAAES